MKLFKRYKSIKSKITVRKKGENKNLKTEKGAGVSIMYSYGFESNYCSFKVHYQEFSNLVEMKHFIKGYETEIFLLKYIQYLPKIKELILDTSGSGFLKNSFLALLYFTLLEREKINVKFISTDTFSFDGRYEDDIKLSGYFLSLIALKVHSRLKLNNDCHTNKIFMKRLFTAIDMRSRVQLFQKPLILAGYNHDQPLEKFVKYNSLSKNIKLAGCEPHQLLSYHARIKYVQHDIVAGLD